jgi:hypothetical protein
MSTAVMNETVNDHGSKHNAATMPNESRCRFPKQLRLCRSKTFLPKPISPTSKEVDALQLAWDILNDKVIHPNDKLTKKSIRDQDNYNIDNAMDEATDTSDDSSS